MQEGCDVGRSNETLNLAHSVGVVGFAFLAFLFCSSLSVGLERDCRLPKNMLSVNNRNRS